MIQKPINTTSEGISPTICAHYHKAGGVNFRPRELGGVMPHIAVMEITPPHDMKDEAITCASRKRGDVHKLELGGKVANSITTINTDSMVIQPNNGGGGYFTKDSTSKMEPDYTSVCQIDSFAAGFQISAAH